MKTLASMAFAALLLGGAAQAQEPGDLETRTRELVDAAREFAAGGELRSLERRDLEKFLAGRGTRLATSVAAAAAERAWRYVAALHYAPPGGSRAARDAVARMFGEFEFEGIAVFASDVRRLAADPGVRTFLEDVVDRLGDPAGDVDLWALAVHHAGGDEREAIRRLAVVFQDLEAGPPGPLHLIEDRSAAELWARAQLLVREADLTRVHLYPGRHEFPPDRWLYHYYVPAELAARLREDGAETRDAFLAPFVMNTEYERYGIEFAGERLDFVGSLRLLSGPSRPFEGPAADEAVPDVYLGYRGALRGSGSRTPPASLADVDRGLRSDPRTLVRRLVGDVE